MATPEIERLNAIIERQGIMIAQLHERLENRIHAPAQPTMGKRFRITWERGAYYVSIPNYQGGEVVDAAEYDRIAALYDSEDKKAADEIASLRLELEASLTQAANYRAQLEDMIAAQAPAAPVETDLFNSIATITIDDEGHRNSELQQVLVAGYVALKWALPLQAASETIEAIAALVKSAPAPCSSQNTAESSPPVMSGVAGADTRLSAGSEGEPFMMLSCREAKQCLHNIPGCICDGDHTNG